MSSDPLDLHPINRLPPKRGRLLVSEPFLPDPYFRRAVVFLCAYGREGAFGFVLNRSMQVDVSSLVEGMPLAGKVNVGGPVQSEELFYLHTFGERLEGSIAVTRSIYMGGDAEQLRTMLATDPKLERHVRFFVGYSGWGQGQLENEIGLGAWLITNSMKRIVMNVRTEHLWENTLRGMGNAFAPLANFPEDPALN